MKAATKISVTTTTKLKISIHAAREGGDVCGFGFCPCLRAISIHAAREGGDFNAHCLEHFSCISIHAAREGGDFSVKNFAARNAISIHAAREGGDNNHEIS